MPADAVTKAEAEKANMAKASAPTKVIIRRLPPRMSESEFKHQLTPLPPQDYFLFVQPDTSVAPWLFSRAYINFASVEDIINFRDRFNGYVFLDSRGNEYPAIVELAPCQKIPQQKNKRKDVKAGSIESDPDYLKFLERLKVEVSLPSIDKTLEEIEKKDKERKEAGKGGPKIKTPLVEYLEQQKEEKEKRREEKRRLEQERRKQKDEERRRRHLKKAKEERERIARAENEQRLRLEERKQTQSDCRGEQYKAETDSRPVQSRIIRSRNRGSGFREDKAQEISKNQFTDQAKTVRPHAQGDSRRLVEFAQASVSKSNRRQASDTSGSEPVQKPDDSAVKARQERPKAEKSASVNPPRRKEAAQQENRSGSSGDKDGASQSTNEGPPSRRKPKPSTQIYQPSARRKQKDS